MAMLDGLVLVTGAAGMIGRALVQRLVEMGCQVRGVLHQRQPGAPALGTRCDADGTVEYVTADLTRKQDCARVVTGVSCVFHAAAVVQGAGATAQQRVLAAAANVRMLVRMIGAVREARVSRFLWMGSTTAYPDAGQQPLREDQLFEGSPPAVYESIGAMYRQGERLCQVLARHDSISVMVLRPSNVYGPGDQFDPARSRVVAGLIRRVVERHDPLTVWGTGAEVRDLVYVDDVVRAMLLALAAAPGYGAWNIGLGKGCTVRQVVETLLEIEQWQPRVVYDARKPSAIPVRLIDVSRAQNDLGFVARVDLREGLQRTVRWYKLQGP
jgi:GDP-L-fucose synthase